jgi:SOS response regulatory protein OraA/RecX
MESDNPGVSIRSPVSTAERMREYRRRRRYGVLSIRMRLATAYIDTLIERRYLKQEHRNDLEEIAIAVADVIADTLTTRNGRLG